MQASSTVLNPAQLDSRSRPTSNMGKFDEKVKTVLGAEAFTILCSAATEDKIDEQKMKDISQQLDPKVEGRHRKRINEKGGQSDNAGMREVLSDWYEVGGLSQLSRDQALDKIASILESSEVDLCPIASELKGKIGADGGDQLDLPSADKVTPEGSGNSEEKLLCNQNNNTGEGGLAKNTGETKYKPYM